ncbi:MAG: insulinase family protein, partial [Comamonas sp.]
DSVFAQAQSLGSYWTMGMPVDAEDQVLRQLMAVTAAQVQSVAARYFGDDQLTVGVLVPQPLAGKKPRPAAAAGGDLH